MKGGSVNISHLFFLSERHQCQRLLGFILQNSSKHLILHVLWDLHTPRQEREAQLFIQLFKLTNI